MSTWSGQLEDLGHLVDNLHALAGVPSQAATQASGEIDAAIQVEFDQGLDPYGEPWEELKQSTLDKGREPPPMTDTEAMRDSLEVRPMRGAGIAVTVGVPYLGFHQGQGSPRANVPPRHVLPEDELPDTWERAIADALDDAIERRLGGT